MWPLPHSSKNFSSFPNNGADFLPGVRAPAVLDLSAPCANPAMAYQNDSGCTTVAGVQAKGLLDCWQVFRLATLGWLLQ